MAFDILSVGHGYKVQQSMYFIPHLTVLAMIVLPMVLPKPMRKPKAEKAEERPKKE